MTLGTAILVALAGVTAGAGFLALRRYSSPASREARRRARSHGAIVSRRRGPSITLAVKVPKSGKRK